MSRDIRLLSIAELQTRYSDGSLTPSETTEACLSRAEEMNSELGAFISIDAQAARAAAQTPRPGPLSGVPLAHKDIFATPDRQPGCGVVRGALPCPPLPPSPLLARMEAAGAIDLGPLNMAGFALGTTGANALVGDARNPWDPAFCTGASSSGSAVAVAAGLAFGSIGTDSGASVRVPAALCGIVGYMPEHGALDGTGCFPLSWSADRPGVLARNVADAALLTAVARGQTPAPVERPAGPLRIGLPESYYTEGLTPAMADAFSAAIRHIEQCGHSVVSVPVVETTEMRSLHRALMRTETAAVHRAMMSSHPELYELSVRKFITGGEGILAVDYVDTLRLRAVMQAEARQLTYAHCDVLLTPTTRSPALRYDAIADTSRAETWAQVTGLAHFTQPASYLGLPAISVPFTLSPDGLPLGVQLIAPAEREATLLSAALDFERHWTELAVFPPLAG
ncbi:MULTISPECIES: amidase [Salipiger]|uniref:amidase n=2 Tax=Roseobacteraceae TaxID=2854170 RepID=UPI003516A5DC